ncbi:MAG: cytochrome c maturation protein CcmE [Paracoccaceae bacterium]|nr:cytochrome c maturation protein CcmE [Paracoccaceae bacterium]
MRSLRKKRRIQIIVLSFVALAVSTALVGYAMRDGINYFRSPSDLAESPPKSGEIFRLGGLVQEGSLRKKNDGEILFRVTDGGATTEVTFNGVLPDLFAENQGMIGMGSLVGEVFVASEILAKHDESYMPKEVMDALKAQGVYQDSDN